MTQIPKKRMLAAMVAILLISATVKKRLREQSPSRRKRLKNFTLNKIQRASKSLKKLINRS